ncbi:MAG: hypothetical protein GX971_03720 [Firmicutes bacterium]|nr:hypothetical protein [Bacillota bacterium]
MKRKQVLFMVLVVFLVAVPGLAATPTGELNASLGYEWDSQQKEVEHTSTLTGFRLVFEDDLDFDAKLHFSTRGWWDWQQENGKLTLDELWLRGYAGDVDYQVGRQQISWGTADGFNPTNYFSRMSSSSLLSGELSGEPIWAGQVSYYAPNWSVTGVIIPIFTPQELDDQMKALMMADPQATPILQVIQHTKKPWGIGTAELALRAETQLASFDVQASYFWGYEPLPGLELVILFEGAPIPVPVKYSYEGTYRRQHQIGLAASGTIGSAGVWGEVTYGGPVKFVDTENPMELRVPMSINERYLQAVVGGDYTLPVGQGLLVQGQYIYRGQGGLFEPYVTPEQLPTELPKPGEIKGAHYLYGRFAYDFSPSSTVDLVMLHGVNEKSGILRPAYTHRFPGAVQLELSLIHSYGDGDFGSIPTQGRVAVKYQF